MPSTTNVVLTTGVGTQIHNGILNKKHIINHSWLHPGAERPVFVGAVTVLIHCVLILLEVGWFHEGKANKRETHRKLMMHYIMSWGEHQPNWYLFSRLRAVWTGEARKQTLAGNGRPAPGVLIVFDRAKRGRPAVWPPLHTDLTASFGSETPC